MTSEIKAILVHGTFDTDASWCKQNSFFREKLTEYLAAKDKNVTFIEFPWDGKNTHTSRSQASQNLAKELASAKNGFGGDCYLICHSHGGNIARRALDLVSKEEQPAGVITYGTPFIQFADRELDLFVFSLRLLASAIAFVLLALVLTLVANYLFSIDIKSNFAAAIAIVSGLIFFIGILCGGIFLSIRLTNKVVSSTKNLIAQSRENLRSDYSSRDIHLTPFICFHVIGDEVSIILRLWVLLTGFLNSILRFIEVIIVLSICFIISILLASIFDIFDVAAMKRWLGEATLLIHQGPPPGVSRKEYLDSFPAATNAPTYLVPAFSMAAYVVLTLIALLVPRYIRRQYFGFGEEGFWGNFATNIHVNRVPHNRSVFELCFFVRELFRLNVRHNHFMKSESVVERTGLYMSEFDLTAVRPAYVSSRYAANSLFVLTAALFTAWLWFAIANDLTLIALKFRGAFGL